MNKHLIGGIAVVAVAIGGVYAYYHYSEVYPSTDNAYVNANLINMAPKVGGYIHKVYVENNQLVHQGDLLVDINPIDYKLQLTKSQQDMELATQQARNLQQQITAAKANQAKAMADYKFAAQMATRYIGLYQQHSGSQQDAERYKNQETQAQQTLEQANIALEQSKIQYQTAQTQIAIAKTNVQNAANNTGYTELRAPVDGYVTNLNLQSGELVQVGQRIFGLVDNSKWWIDVNYKETQLKRIKPGQSATIELDMYDHKYSGTVQSLSYASGNTFSLLPAENATGNWVKVTQRFTVRVRVKNDPAYPLRVGASSKVTINTAE